MTSEKIKCDAKACIKGENWGDRVELLVFLEQIKFKRSRWLVGLSNLFNEQLWSGDPTPRHSWVPFWTLGTLRVKFQLEFSGYKTRHLTFLRILQMKRMFWKSGEKHTEWGCSLLGTYITWDICGILTIPASSYLHVRDQACTRVHQMAFLSYLIIGLGAGPPPTPRTLNFSSFLHDFHFP